MKNGTVKYKIKTLCKHTFYADDAWINHTKTCNCKYCNYKACPICHRLEAYKEIRELLPDER